MVEILRIHTAINHQRRRLRSGIGAAGARRPIDNVFGGVDRARHVSRQQKRLTNTKIFLHSEELQLREVNHLGGRIGGIADFSKDQFVTTVKLLSVYLDFRTPDRTLQRCRQSSLTQEDPGLVGTKAVIAALLGVKRPKKLVSDRVADGQVRAGVDAEALQLRQTGCRPNRQTDISLGEVRITVGIVQVNRIGRRAPVPVVRIVV